MQQTIKAPNRGGEFRYTTPEVEVYEIVVEKGFANSITEDEGVESNDYDETKTKW